MHACRLHAVLPSSLLGYLLAASSLLPRYLHPKCILASSRHAQIALNYAAISLFKCLVGMLLLSHWFACVWGLQASFVADKTTTWLYGAGLCEYSTSLGSSSNALEANESNAAVSDADNTTEVVCAPPGMQYSAAIYWAVMTITSIGYGDISATSANVSEQIVCTLLMTLGAIGWGMVLGTIVSNLQSLDPEGDLFRATMSELNKMMSTNDLPRGMQVRLREYAQETVHVRLAKKRAELLEIMSPALKAEVHYHYQAISNR